VETAASKHKKKLIKGNRIRETQKKKNGRRLRNDTTKPQQVKRIIAVQANAAEKWGTGLLWGVSEGKKNEDKENQI